MLEIKNLTYLYPNTDQPALQDIHFSLAEGEILLVAGGTGSGKSTLCYTLGGLVPHFYRGQLTGGVLFNDHSLREVSLRQWVQQVGLLLQNPFNQLSAARMTVFEEVAFGLENLGVPRAEMQERITAVLAQLRITELAQRSPYHLSGGQMQRVALACMLVLRPKLLVLDEPTAQLDPQSTREVLAILHQLAKQGSTIVIATHKLAIVSSIATHALILHQGRIACFGTARMVLSDLRLPYWNIEPPIYVPIAARLGLEPPYPTTHQQAVDAFSTNKLTVTPMGKMADQWPFNASANASAPPSQEEGGISLHNTGPMRLPLMTSAMDVPVNGSQAQAFASTMPVVVETLHFTYPGQIDALRGVSLTLKPGRITALIGGNGAGKSTLSRMINGLQRPTAGTVRIGFWKTSEYSVSELARWVGYLYQHPDEQLFKGTIAEEVAFGPQNFGWEEDKIQNAVQRALRLTDLTDMADAHPQDLHPTTRRWVALASVLAQRTPVLILDEPTTGFDLADMQRMSALLNTLKRASYTILLISHDMQFIAEHADDIYLMAKGQLIAQGNAHTLFRDQHTLQQANICPAPIIQLANALHFGPQIVTATEFVDAAKAKMG